MAKNRCAWLAMAGILLALPSWAAADGVVRDGVGARSTARGGTNLGHADTGVMILDNPAAMVNLGPYGLFEIGNDAMTTDLDYNDPENSTNGIFWPMTLPYASLVRKSHDGWFAAGIGVFAPAGFGGRWHITNPVLGQHGYKSFGAFLKVLPAVAVGVTDRLSIGGALGIGISHAELEAPFFLQTGQLAGAPTLFDLQATGVAPTWNVGLQYLVSDRTTLGVTYTDETRFRMDGNLDVEVFGLTQLPQHSDFDARVDLVWPRSVGLGVKHDATCCDRFSVDVIWYDWSHAFENVDLKLTDSTNALFRQLLGPAIRDRLPLDWDDSISTRLGYERFLDETTVLRCGYVYHPNPIPDSTLTPLIPAVLQHAFAAGLGKQWGCISVDLAYQFSFGVEQHVGVSRLVGGDFDNSDVKAQAHWVGASVSYAY